MRPSYHPWLVLLLALVIRGSGLWLGLESLSDDPDAYAKLAVNWSQSGVLGEVAAGVSIRPTAYRPPLYPWLLSWLVTAGSLPIGSVALLHLVLGVATVWLTWSIAHALGQPLAWLPAAAVAVDPLLLRASQLVMTETLAAFLAVLAWRMWLAVWPPRERATRDADGTGDRGRTQWLALLALGLVWGLSVLARPTAAPWVVLCLLGLCFCGRFAWRQRLADCGWLTLIVLCCITPWTWRNYRTFGQPIWATTHGGYTLLLANNPLLFQHFSASGPSRNWDAAPFHAAWARRHGTQTGDPATRDYWLAPSLAATAQSGSPRPAPPQDAEASAADASVPYDELADDALAYTAAKATIARQPGMFALSCLYRVGWLWALWPNTGPLSLRLAIGLWYAAVCLLAAAGLWRGVHRSGGLPWLLPLGLLLSLTLVHAVYWSNMRMRAPLMAAAYVAVSEIAIARRRQSGYTPEIKQNRRQSPQVGS